LKGVELNASNFKGPSTGGLEELRQKFEKRSIQTLLQGQVAAARVAEKSLTERSGKAG
jgi:hypothetical protein